MVTAGGKLPNCLAKSISIKTITLKFCHFHDGHSPKSTFKIKHDNISLKISAKPQKVTLYIITTGGNIPIFNQNIITMTITYEF